MSIQLATMNWLGGQEHGFLFHEQCNLRRHSPASDLERCGR